MKKLLLFLSFFMIGSFGAVQAGERQKGFPFNGKECLAIAGVTAAYGLGIKIATGTFDLVDLKASFPMAVLSTYGACLFNEVDKSDKVAGAACMVGTNAFMCAYTWAKIQVRLSPAPGGQRLP